MKKILLFSALVALIAILGSCKAHEKCPAYGHSGHTTEGRNA